MDNRVKKITYFYYESSAKEPLRILDAGYHETKNGNHSTQRILDHYVLHCVVRGKGIYRIHDQIYHLSQGDCFLLPPSIPILYQSDILDPWVYYWIGMDGIDIDHLMQMCGFEVEKPVIHYDRVEELIDHVKPLVEMEKTSLGDSYKAIGELYQLCSLLVTQKGTESAPSRKEKYVKQAEALIRDSYYKNRSVAEIASQLGLDRTYLYRIFIAVTGKSIQQYITDLRINRARYFLKQTDLSISEVAFYCGYKSEQYFSMAFHKETGFSPTAYRRNS